MPLLLCIDTAQEKASICLSENEKPIAFSINNAQQEHAGWLHAAIQTILNDTNYRLQDLTAIAVSNGPGSYTGLRVGLSAAKGLCYVLQIPLITIGTLEIMAQAILSQTEGLICPVIDARRMEVYTAIYDQQMQVLLQPTALLLTGDSFSAFLDNHKLSFTGSGADKLQTIVKHSNAIFFNYPENSSSMPILAAKALKKNQFANLVYAEPFYLKEFYTNQSK